jgi:hypothetical protein
MLGFAKTDSKKIKGQVMTNILFQWGWYSGTGAVVDWLDGFEEANTITNQGSYFSTEDGIYDLLTEEDIAKKLKIIKNLKIKIITNAIELLPFEYYRRLVKHIHPSDYYNRKFISYFFTFYHFLSQEARKLRRGHSVDEYLHWKKWLNYSSRLGSKKKFAILNCHANIFNCGEMFSGHNNIWPKLFEPFKLIFVHRDPLDQFADLVKEDRHLNVNCHIAPRYFGSDVGCLSAIDRFFITNKRFHLAKLRMAEQYGPDRMAIVSYEDFLQKHSTISEQLKSFLGIKSERNPKNDHFVLEQSMKNIGIGKDNKQALSLLAEKPHVLDELYKLREQLNLLPHAIH